jgi:hypothetical protein
MWTLLTVLRGNLRAAFCAATLVLVLAGCAEKNFVPGSPLARLNGYNRSYEQIAADDCTSKYGFARGSDMHKRCVYELSVHRRQSDDARMQAAGQTGAALMATGAAMMAPQPLPAPPPLSTPQSSAPAGMSQVCYHAMTNTMYTCN